MRQCLLLLQARVQMITSITGESANTNNTKGRSAHDSSISNSGESAHEISTLHNYSECGTAGESDHATSTTGECAHDNSTTGESANDSSAITIGECTHEISTNKCYPKHITAGESAHGNSTTGESAHVSSTTTLGEIAHDSSTITSGESANDNKYYWRECPY